MSKYLNTPEFHVRFLYGFETRVGLLPQIQHPGNGTFPVWAKIVPNSLQQELGSIWGTTAATTYVIYYVTGFCLRIQVPVHFLFSSGP